MSVQLLADNLLKTSTIMSAQTLAGFSTEALKKGKEYIWWKSVSAPSEIVIDCGAPVPVDYLFISGHNISGPIALRASTDNFSGSNVLIESQSATPNDPILFLFSSSTYRYWKIAITQVSTALSVVMMGKSLEIPGHIGGTFDPLGRKFMGMKNVNENGYPLGTSYLHETWEEKVAVLDVPMVWMRTVWLPAWRRTLRDNPLALVWNPTVHPDDVQVVAVKGGFDSKHQSGGLVDLSFTVIGRYQ